MARNINQPMRMCIACRQRAAQNTLIRLQYNDGKLCSYGGVGRSFYICSVCMDENKKLTRALSRVCRTNITETVLNRLKEIIID
jgi:predicted RNA-binding protein YlxR (DUF448 family)